MTKGRRRGGRKGSRGGGWWPWVLLAILGLLGIWLSYLHFAPKPPPLPPTTLREVRGAVQAALFEMGLGRQRVEITEGGYRVLLPPGLKAESVRDRLLRGLSGLKGVGIQVIGSPSGVLVEVYCPEGILKVELCPAKAKGPMVSVVVDDLGRNPSLAQAFMDLGEPFALALLPHEPYSREIAEKAHRRGFEVLVHIPMEPKAYPLKDPGEGALLTSMDEDQLREVIRSDIEAIPFAIGANNHMGSRFMEKAEKVALLMEALSERGLFFLDSLTTPRSQGETQARAKGVRFFRRDVFLDNSQNPSDFLAQWQSLVEVAERRGWAIGICHPHRATLQGLALALEARKVEVVPLSWLPDLGNR